MGKYFGTDGVRGIANTELDSAVAYRMGRALACELYTALGRKPRVAWTPGPSYPPPITPLSITA